MGLMMMMGKRKDQGHSGPAKEQQPLPDTESGNQARLDRAQGVAKEQQPLPATERSQECQTPESPSPMNMIASCMKHCLNWKVLAGLAAVALVIGVVAPGWLPVALPTLLVLICPLSMLIMLLAMGFSKRNRGQQTSASCCTQSAGPSSEVAPESVVETSRSEMPERDPVKY